MEQLRVLGLVALIVVVGVLRVAAINGLARAR
jgi:hypothetical protein